MIRKYIPQKTRKIIYDKYKVHCAYCGNEITFKQMQVAINFGVIKIEKWDGLFYFERK
jgi:predicted restriction endonuclease